MFEDELRRAVNSDSWASVLERTDRILTRRPLAVRVEPKGNSQPLAWTDGENITINSSRVSTRATVENVVALKAVNYHELCHVMFSPRTSDEVTKSIVADSSNATLQQAYNILEDARIENLFVGIYSPAARFFQAMVSEFIIKSSEDNPRTHLLTYGRKYLSPRLRKEARSRYEPITNRTDAESIIDDYLVLDPCQEPIKALDLIKRFAAIIGAGNDPGQVYGSERLFKGGKQPGLSTGGVRKSEFDRALKAVKKGLKEEPTRPITKASGESSSSVKDEAKKALDDILGSADVQKDAGTTIESVNAAGRMPGRGRGRSALTLGSLAVPSEYRRAARKITDRLRRLNSDVEAETQTRQFHGRLDLRRAMRAEATERDVFKVWDRGHEDEVQVEAVILCDRSGSMRKITNLTSYTLWALKRGLEVAGVRTTVIAFDTDHWLVYGPYEIPKPGTCDALLMDGGTNPTTAIAAAELLLSKSARPNKVLVCLTDGGWVGLPAESGLTVPARRDRSLSRMQRSGVVDHLMLLGEPARDKRGFTKATEITKIDQLVTAVSDIVYAVQRRALRTI